MIKRPSFPVYRATAQAPRRSFDRRLTIATFVLAVIVAAALLVRAAGPMETSSDPETYMVAP
jgi:hypothetical protein